MNTINRYKLLILCAAVAGIPMLGVSQVNAFGRYGSGENIVDMIATRFNLKPEDVQSVFNQARQEHFKQIENSFEKKLDQAVSEQKISAAQKQMLLDKFKSIHENNQEWIDLPSDERRQKMLEQKNDLLEWAKKNNIDTQYLFWGRGLKMGMGMR